MSIKSDKDWEAENDARALAEATKIKADKKRLARAAKAAKALARDALKEAKVHQKTASTKIPKAKKKATKRPRSSGRKGGKKR